jgi:hypothetical protein
MSKVGGRKRNESAIFNTWIIQEKTKEGSYYMVKIPCVEPGDTRTQLWRKEQGQSKRGRRLEDYNKEQTSTNQ